MKFVWTFPNSDTYIVEVPAVGHISDGLWHEVEMLFHADNVTLCVDKILVHRQANHKHSDEFVLYDRAFFIGGLPQNTSVFDETYGFFKSNFVGCIKSLWGEQENSVNLLSYDGENVGNCEMF